MISLPFVLSLSITVFSQHAYERIKLNQLGFYPNGPKLAVITGETEQRN
ncbi:MAG: cellulase N-terminal Ig-like domain-containing protein, partial [Flavisolibacter sp.]